MTTMGYIILTSQADGSWRDDWDGEVHPDLAAGRAELAKATAGDEDDEPTAILTKVVRVDDGQEDAVTIEMIDAVHRFECNQRGHHDIDETILAVGSIDPVLLICGHCGWTGTYTEKT